MGGKIIFRYCTEVVIFETVTIFVTVQTQVFSEPKIPYAKVVVTDFCHLECEAWQKSVTVHTMCVQ